MRIFRKYVLLRVSTYSLTIIDGKVIVSASAFGSECIMTKRRLFKWVIVLLSLVVVRRLLESYEQSQKGGKSNNNNNYRWRFVLFKGYYIQRLEEIKHGTITHPSVSFTIPFILISFQFIICPRFQLIFSHQGNYKSFWEPHQHWYDHGHTRGGWVTRNYLTILLDNAPVEWKIVGKIQTKSGKHTGGSFFIQVGNQLEYS